jgi:ribosome-associated protein
MSDNILDLKNADSKLLASEAVKILLEKKALDVKMFFVKEFTSVTEYYVNATGRSSTQVAALADDVADMVSLKGREPLRIEGRSGNAWILVDYGDVIINVFDRPSREFYDFDRHLPENSRVDISDLAAEVDKKFELNS